MEDFSPPSSPPKEKRRIILPPRVNRLSSKKDDSSVSDHKIVPPPIRKKNSTETAKKDEDIRPLKENVVGRKIIIKSPKKETYLGKDEINILVQPNIVRRKIIIKSPKKQKQLTLMSHQFGWYNKIINQILPKSKLYVDTSEMRVGKSYISTKVGITLGLSFFVICPVTVKHVWEGIRDEYKLDFIEIITYDSLRGRIGSKLKHDWLDRVTTDKTLDFYPSDDFKTLVKSGVMLILDEGHMIKNASIQYHACQALINYIQKSNSKSIVAILTATMMTKPSSAIQFLNVSGYMNGKNTYIYNKSAKFYNFAPTNELIEKCRKLDANTTDQITSLTLNKQNCNIIVSQLFLKVILPTISGSAPKPDKDESDFKFDIANGFYNLTGLANSKLEKAISDLEKAIEYVTSINKKLSRGQVKHLMSNIEIAKVGIFARVTYKILNDNPNTKVILALNYNQPIKDLIKIFEKYEPLVMTGSTKQDLRLDIIESFSNNPNKRLLIGNTRVLGFGIDLSDQTGDSPRTMLIASDYMVTNIHQAAARINCNKLKSDAIVRIVYGKNTGDRENKILKTMVDDSIVLRSTLDPENSKDIKLPGEYDNVYEDDTENVENNLDNHETDEILNNIDNLSNNDENDFDDNIEHDYPSDDDS